MPTEEAPCVELGSAPQTPSVIASPSPSEISSTSSPEPEHIRATPLFRALALPPPDPEQPSGQDELERRLPGYRRIVIPRELTLIELLKQYSGVTTDEEVLRIREVKLRVVAERVGLRRLNILAPRLSSLTLDGSALSSLRDLGIGLVRLKILSVNRCGLHSLDGVWGLGSLRELHAASNRLRDLQPLAALQKLHTLDLADNSLLESSRLWTLGVCGALRRLTLRGTDAANSLHYQSSVASAIPMLLYLDDLPLHVDSQYNSDEEFGTVSSSSDSGESDAGSGGNAPMEPKPGPSTNHFEKLQCDTEITWKPFPEHNMELPKGIRLQRQRPATTEGAGVRPSRPQLTRRPNTAIERGHVDVPTRLQIMHTLMDEEWRCTGSQLTSRGAVCGNLARALRRTPANYHQQSLDAKQELVEQTMEDATRALAAEIPRAPRLEDWIKFKESTGIDINIDFNERLQESDPSKAIERLERIEKETMERFKCEEATGDRHPTTDFSKAASSFVNSKVSMNDDLLNFESLASVPRDLYSLFDNSNDTTLVRTARNLVDNDNLHTE